MRRSNLLRNSDKMGKVLRFLFLSADAILLVSAYTLYYMPHAIVKNIFRVYSVDLERSYLPHPGKDKFTPTQVYYVPNTQL